MRRVILGLLAMGALLVAPAAYGDIIYNNGGPNHVNVSDMTHWIQAEDFMLGSDADITDVHFWSLEKGSGYAGSVTWWIYADAGGAPGSILASGNTNAVTRALTGFTQFGGHEWTDDFTIPGFAAAAGVTYWLGLHNGPLADTARGTFFWETSADHGNNGHEKLDPNGAWFSNGFDHAFYLTGTTSGVPEPGTLSLLGLGIGALVARRKRRS